MLKKMLAYLPLDGYANNANYVRISSNFPYYHRNVFGISSHYRVGYLDTTGKNRIIKVPLWMPDKDTLNRQQQQEALTLNQRKLRKLRIENLRSFRIDSNLRTGFMTLNTFSNGTHRQLRRFFRRSFRQMKQQDIRHFVLDLRGNGGGDITISSLLTRYIRHTPFKVADSVYSCSKNFNPFTPRVRMGFLSNIGLTVLTRKRADGLFHFGYWERHWYQPKKRNHFNGKVWVLINGPTFSASTLFCNAVKGQDNVTLVGEEAGGGWHGNNGVMIPDITLPNTRLRVRLPFFRIVQFNHIPKNGLGVQPDIWLPPTVEGVRKGQDRKMMLVKSLISAGE
jgi:C-terminal processing protease CtpA/Prc